MQKIVHKRAVEYKDLMSGVEVDKVKSKLATKIMAAKMKVSMDKLRQRVRTQAHVRGFHARHELAHLLKLLEIQRMASFKAEALWRVMFERSMLVKRSQAAISIQAGIRRFLGYRFYQRRKGDKTVAQAFTRMVVLRNKFLTLQEWTTKAQRAWRVKHMQQWYMATKLAALKIEGAYFNYMMKALLAKYVAAMDSACSSGKLEEVQALLDVGELDANGMPVPGSGTSNRVP